jgi:4-amino-4-deoxy-L-arabinose transferase-like glycosyltransferase
MNLFLTFSDGAKFADIARNLVNGNGYSSNFSFFSTGIFKVLGNNLFSASGTPVAMSYAISIFFRIFGASDLSVIFTSVFFFALLVLATYLLGQRLFGKLVGALSAIAVVANKDFLNYATSGASEPLFTFLAVISLYLILLKKWWTNILFFTSLALLYLTRPQGIIFIGILLLAWLLINFKVKKALAIFSLAIVGIFIFDRFILYPLSFKYPVYPILTRGIQALFQYSPAEAVSNALRGGQSTTISVSDILKKTFYNLYNFYKLIPEIISPYMWTLFIIGIIIWTKNKAQNVYKFSTILIVVGSFLLTALTIPFYRYLHPVIPFVYIISIATLVWIVEKIFSGKKSIIIISTLLILFFGVGQTLGVIFLDARFERNIHNVGKVPVYVELSKILKENTKSNQIVVTNLDTWGSWYGERKTVWFPIEPKQIIDPDTGKIPFDAIYLTSYKIDDENYYMGKDWRLIFNNPNDSRKWTCSGCSEIAKEFILKGVYKISSLDNYEKQDASAILLIKKY